MIHAYPKERRRTIRITPPSRSGEGLKKYSWVENGG